MVDKKEYEELLNLFIQLIQSQAGNKIVSGDEWMNDAQTLSIKLFRHLGSMHLISNGSTINHDGTVVAHFIDHASIKILARAALETYLVFYYIFVCKDLGLSKFRHSTWVLGGLFDRQSTHVSNEKHRAVLDSEKIQIEELEVEIKNSKYLQQFSLKQQKQILRGKWKIDKKWSDLGVNAGFHKKYFEQIYSYLCGYSHSSYISALQVGQAKSIDDQTDLTSSILGIGTVIMAHYAFSYTELFESAGEVLNSNKPAKAIVEKWSFGATDMAEIYER